MNRVPNVVGKLKDNHRKVAAELLPVVYAELRRLAAFKMAQERPGQTLSATALVHEAFIRITKKGDAPNWDSKGHFFAAAAEAMRRILIEAAQRKKAIKRGGDRIRMDLDIANCNLDFGDLEWSDQILELNEAIKSLEDERPEAAQLVKLRYFGGMKMDDAAKAMNVSERTAHRYWKFAKAWLFQEICD